MKKRIGLVIFFALILLNQMSAFIILPPAPKSVSKGNFTYCASYCTTDDGQNFIGTIVVESKSVPKYEYEIPIYAIRLNKHLEGDVQWVFIKKIKFENNSILTITNYEDDVFELDINTFKVECKSKPSRVFDFNIDTFKPDCDPKANDLTVKSLYEIEHKEKIKSNKKYSGTQPQDKKLSKIEDVIALAEKTLFQIYGQETIRSEMPYKIFRYKNKWIVEGSLSEHSLGGVFRIIINADTSQIESVIHYE